ncbi:hypothetical protein ARAM_006314 [Aspergillus rambellii]|uniref:Uncharacterized protein n=1 Tax=Aspergillus rambellii TaxID=308745 RepID=A0A0F8W9L0_9EURO|nr:hypothetical protein ARAM_006314 [Aspergillus rambellii]
MSGSNTPNVGDGSSTPRPARSSRRGGRGRGRGRGGRGHSHQQAPVSSANNAPQTEQTRSGLAPPPQIQPQPQPQNEAANPNTTPSSGQRSRRGPRGGRRRSGRGGSAQQEASQRPARTRAAGGRAFQGRLTRPPHSSEDGLLDGQEDTAADLGLRADAPAFVPGVSQPNGSVSAEPSSVLPSAAAPHKGKGKAKNARSRPAKVTTKSEAEDIVTRIHEDISNNLYECPICTIEIGRKSRVWSCRLCWTVFHLSCVKKWSKNEGAAAQDASRRAGEEGDASTPLTPAGVRRKSTHARSLVSLRTPAGRHVPAREKDARTLATRLATLDLVLLVLRWDRLRIAFVAGTPLRNAARTPTTTMDGAAERYVVIYYHAANIRAPDHAMRDYVALARILRILRSGRDVSAVETNAIGPLIAAFTFAKGVAIPKMRRWPIARDPRMWYHTVLAERLDSRVYRDTLLERPAKTQFQTAWRPVVRFCAVDTRVKRFATQVLVVLACELSR